MSIDEFAFSKIEISSRALFLKAHLLKNMGRWVTLKRLTKNMAKAKSIKPVSAEGL